MTISPRSEKPSCRIDRLQRVEILDTLADPRHELGHELTIEDGEDSNDRHREENGEAGAAGPQFG